MDLDDFLRRNGWEHAARHTLAGDASSRRYLRLNRDGARAIVMISPSIDEVARFGRVANWLLSHGFSAPRIHAQDGGLMLLEDLGDDLIFDLLIRDPSHEQLFYDAITDMLLALHQIDPPDFVAPLDGPALSDLTRIAPDWAPMCGPDIVPEVIVDLAVRLDDLPPVMCLRDFHAQNMLWLPARDGIAKLGVLDFQDAVKSHPVYDLVSALQDVRRDVSPAIEGCCIARYTAARGLDADAFAADYALIGAQRALRIHAVFARLCLGMGKAHYVDLMPRNWALLQRNLAHPSLGPLARAVEQSYLPPDANLLKRLKSECGTRPLP